VHQERCAIETNTVMLRKRLLCTPSLSCARRHPDHRAVACTSLCLCSCTLATCGQICRTLTCLRTGMPSPSGRARLQRACCSGAPWTSTCSRTPNPGRSSARVRATAGTCSRSPRPAQEQRTHTRATEHTRLTAQGCRTAAQEHQADSAIAALWCRHRDWEAHTLE